MNRRDLMIIAATAPLLLSSNAKATDLSVPIRFDARGRPVVDVLINGRGPFAFVVDTAAQGTVITGEMVRALTLTPNGNQGFVHGASGARGVDLYTLSSIDVGPLHKQNVQAMSMGDAMPHGILGAPFFSGARIAFDMLHNRLFVNEDAARAPLTGSVAAIEFRGGIFALIPIRVGAVHATGVIDTGGRRAAGNNALRSSLGFSEGDARLHSIEPISGLSGHTTPTLAGDAGPLTIADQSLGNFELAFADLPVFAALGLNDGPCLLVAADVLHRMRGFSIDYSSAQFQVRV